MLLTHSGKVIDHMGTKVFPLKAYLRMLFVVPPKLCRTVSDSITFKCAFISIYRLFSKYLYLPPIPKKRKDEALTSNMVAFGVGIVGRNCSKLWQWQHMNLQVLLYEKEVKREMVMPILYLIL